MILLAHTLLINIVSILLNNLVMNKTFKVCTICDIPKELEEYCLNKHLKSGRNSSCRECMSKKHKLYREKNKEKIQEYKKKYQVENREKRSAYHREYRNKNKERLKDYERTRRDKNRDKFREYSKEYRKNNIDTIKAREKEYRDSNKEKIKAYGRRYYENNSDRLIEKNKKYRIENRDKYNESNRKYLRKKRREDPQYRVKMNISRHIYCKLKSEGRKKDKNSVKYLGCDIDCFKRHIESFFSEEMNWDNYGEVWHIDHTIPCSSWDHLNEFDIFCCWNYRNLKPMLKEENLKKGNKYSKKDKERYVRKMERIYPDSSS